MRLAVCSTLIRMFSPGPGRKERPLAQIFLFQLCVPC